MSEPGDSEHAGLLIQHRFHFVDGQAFLCGDEAQNGRIDVAGSRSHHESFERSHAHGCIDGAPTANSGGGTSVSEVQAYDISILPWQIANRAIAITHVSVGDAVEAVAADPVAQVEMIRNRVQIRALRQRVVKRRIENRHLRNPRAQQLAHRANSPEIRGIVQGGEVDAIFDSAHNLVGNEDGIRKKFTAVHHAMSDRVNVTHTLDFRNTRLGRCDPADDEIERAGNIFQGGGKFLPGAVAFLHGDDGFGADTLDLAAQQANVLILADPLKIGGDDLKLQAGASGIDDQNVH